MREFLKGTMVLFSTTIVALVVFSAVLIISFSIVFLLVWLIFSILSTVFMFEYDDNLLYITSTFMTIALLFLNRK